MSERPIIFSAPMVRAILAGSKTQTRRLVTDATSQGNWSASELDLSKAWVDPGPSPAGNPGPYLKAAPTPAALAAKGWTAEDEIVDRLFPRWFVGDRLWVRETFTIESSYDVGDYEPPFKDGRPVKRVDDEDHGSYWLQPHYRATDPEPELTCNDPCRGCDNEEPHAHWQPSIHMPRWASRITLEITEVRAQPLHTISEEDAIAEGISAEALPSDPDNFHPPGSYGYVPGHLPFPQGRIYPSAREAVRDLWDAINGHRATWDSNPWVWAITFRRAA